MIEAKLNLLSYTQPFRRGKRKPQQNWMNNKITLPTRLILMQHWKKTMDFVCMSMVLKSTTVPLHSMDMKTVFIVCATDVIMTLHLLALQKS